MNKKVITAAKNTASSKNKEKLIKAITGLPNNSTNLQHLDIDVLKAIENLIDHENNVTNITIAGAGDYSKIYKSIQKLINETWWYFPSKTKIKSGKLSQIDCQNINYSFLNNEIYVRSNFLKINDLIATYKWLVDNNINLGDVVYSLPEGISCPGVLGQIVGIDQWGTIVLQLLDENQETKYAEIQRNGYAIDRNAIVAHSLSNIRNFERPKYIYISRSKIADPLTICEFTNQKLIDHYINAIGKIVASEKIKNSKNANLLMHLQELRKVLGETVDQVQKYQAVNPEPEYKLSESSFSSEYLEKENTPSYKGIQHDLREAGYRVFSFQVLKAFQALIVASLEKLGAGSEKIQSVASLIDTEYGRAILSMLLGMILTYSPPFQNHHRIAKVAKECRIQSITLAGNELFSDLMAGIVPVISEQLSSLDSKETDIIKEEDLFETLENPKEVQEEADKVANSV